MPFQVLALGLKRLLEQWVPNLICGAPVLPVRNTRMAGLVAFDWEVTGSLLHSWFNLITFMVVQFIQEKMSWFITFMVKFYYICGSWIYYICGEKLLHLWLVSHSWSNFITFMVGITFMVFITFMGDTKSTDFMDKPCFFV